MKTKKEIMDWIDKVDPKQLSFFARNLFPSIQSPFFDRDHFIELFINWLLKEKIVEKKDRPNIATAIICTEKTKSYDLFKISKQKSKIRVAGKFYYVKLAELKKNNACTFLLDLQKYIFDKEKREKTFAKIEKREREFKKSLRSPKTRYKRE